MGHLSIELPLCSLQVLDLGANLIDNKGNESNQAFKKLKNLKKLFLYSSKIKCVDELEFEELNSLLVLSLNSNFLNSCSVKTFSNLKHLKFLNLSSNKIRLIEKDLMELG